MAKTPPAIDGEQDRDGGRGQAVGGLAEREQRAGQVGAERHGENHEEHPLNDVYYRRGRAAAANQRRSRLGEPSFQHGPDPPHTRGGRLLFLDDELPERPGVLHVGAAADFLEKSPIV